jgi:pimeloyl-ACP methyl ester carboxylesterase
VAKKVISLIILLKLIQTMNNSTVTFKDKTVNYRIQGHGKCLVLLHGFLESMEIWDNFSTELSHEFKVLAIDLPGHGKTEMLADVHTMELMADVVKSVLEHLKIQECVMIGHSMGGYVTLEFASKYPEYLWGIGLFHSTVFADSTEAKQNRDRTMEIVKSDRQGFIRNFIPDLFAPENRSRFTSEIRDLKEEASKISKSSIIAALAGMKERRDHQRTASVMDVPVMVIAGKEDQRIPVNKVIEMIALPKHCDVLILSRVGHMGYIEAKEETLEKCRYFTRKCFLV